MHRRCTDATKRQIVAQSHFGPHSARLRAAVHDALHDKPVSLERERWLCNELGIEPPYRPRVRRPWMGAELTAEMDKAGVTDATVRWLVTRYIFEKELAGPMPGLEVVHYDAA